MSCFGFLKNVMFLFNGVICLAGAALLGVGVWVKVDSGNFLSFLQNIPQAPGQMLQLLNVGYLLMVVGALLLILGFLACCGAVKESRCMLLTFFCIVLVVFIAEVAGAVFLLVFKSEFKNLIQQINVEAVKYINENYECDPEKFSPFNMIMTELQCCGINNFTDFMDNLCMRDWDNYPGQCCKSAAVCSWKEASDSLVPGCFQALESLMESHSATVILAALSITALQVGAMMVSLILYCQIKPDYSSDDITIVKR